MKFLVFRYPIFDVFCAYVTCHMSHENPKVSHVTCLTNHVASCDTSIHPSLFICPAPTLSVLRFAPFFRSHSVYSAILPLRSVREASSIEFCTMGWLCPSNSSAANRMHCTCTRTGTSWMGMRWCTVYLVPLNTVECAT